MLNGSELLLVIIVICNLHNHPQMAVTAAPSAVASFPLDLTVKPEATRPLAATGAAATRRKATGAAEDLEHTTATFCGLRKAENTKVFRGAAAGAAAAVTVSRSEK